MNPAWIPIILAIIDLIKKVAQRRQKWLHAEMETAAARLGIPPAEIGRSSARVLRAVYDGIPLWRIGGRRQRAFVKAVLDTAPVALTAAHGLTEPEAALIAAADAA